KAKSTSLFLPVAQDVSTKIASVLPSVRRSPASAAIGSNTSFTPRLSKSRSKRMTAPLAWPTQSPSLSFLAGAITIFGGPSIHNVTLGNSNNPANAGSSLKLDRPPKSSSNSPESGCAKLNIKLSTTPKIGNFAPLGTSSVPAISITSPTFNVFVLLPFISSNNSSTKSTTGPVVSPTPAKSPLTISPVKSACKRSLTPGTYFVAP